MILVHDGTIPIHTNHKPLHVGKIFYIDMVLQQMKINKIEQGVEDVYLICMDEDINFNRHIYVIISGPNYPIF